MFPFNRLFSTSTRQKNPGSLPSVSDASPRERPATDCEADARDVNTRDIDTRHAGGQDEIEQESTAANGAHDLGTHDNAAMWPLAQPSTRRTRLATRAALLILTLAAFGLRLFHLDVQSLWYDEGVTAEMARRSFAELTRWTAQDIQPPLYYYVVAVWGRLTGWSEWSLRFPSVFFGVMLVPLLAALAGALMRKHTGVIMAALLVAAHPLLLYYSQEARMYAMLTLLTVALAYYLLSRRGNRLSTPVYWGGYVLLAAAAIYTHYFAFFFIGGLGVVFLVDLLIFRNVSARQTQAMNAGMRTADTPPVDTPSVDTPLVDNPSLDGPSAAGSAGDSMQRQVWQRLWHFCLANVVLLVVYVPWLSAMLSQLSTDASYWEGEFKLDEAIRHVANRFTSGETVVEAQATQLLVFFGLLTVLALAALLFAGRYGRRTLLIGLLWLVLPVTGILGLAQVVPKFNARYAIIALPGLLLLWSAGLTQIMPGRRAKPQPAQTNNARFWNPALKSVLWSVRGLSAAVLGLFLLAVFAFANYNWYTDMTYTKAEWRQVSQFIRNRIGSDVQAGESSRGLVVLVSGHAWPVWNYYAPDLPPLRLPDLEILDVNEVLDFATTARPMRRALQDVDDVWLVEWQDDIVDPMKIVPLQLHLAGAEQPVRDQFWHLNISHYTDIHADAVLIEPTGISESSVNFSDQLYLLDYTVAENGDLLLFWQLHPNHDALPGDLRVTAELFTGAGLPFYRMVDRRPAGFDYPVFRWQEDQITLGRIPAADWAGPGALPGQYRMRLRVYDIDGDLSGLEVLGDSAQPLGKHTILELELPVTAAGRGNVDKVTFAEMVDDLWLEVAIDMELAEPGQAIAAELYWYVEPVADERREVTPIEDFDLQLHWRFRNTDEILGQQTYSVAWTGEDTWRRGELLRSLHQWRPPQNLPPGDYWLEISLSAADSASIRVPMRIQGSTRRYAPPAYASPVDRVFDEQLHLLGIIEPLEFQPRAGGQVALTLVWQATEAIADDYTVTVQWLGPDNRPASQVDLSLPGGSSNWLDGQVELQSVFVNVPETPGTYRLVAAVYNPNLPDLPRLLARDGEDLIELATLTVVE